MHGQALKSLFTLKSYLIRFPNMTVNHKLDQLDKLIEPILNDSCEIWGVNAAVKLENIHMHFCKSILGVRSQTNNNFVNDELGRYPLRLIRIERVIKYWFKVVKCTSTTYIKHIYNATLQELNMYPNKNSWAKSVQTIIENLVFKIYG